MSDSIETLLLHAVMMQAPGNVVVSDTLLRQAIAQIENLTAERDHWRAQAEHTYPGKGR